MDEIVIRSMLRWPDVPAVYGWLDLDRRGQWRIKGERIANAGLAAFIGRNYACDIDGRWYFQNGPQRVFVRLHYLPYVVRLKQVDGRVDAIGHTGIQIQRVDAAWLDEDGTMSITFEEGVGSIHDLDMGIVADLLSGPRGAPATEKDISDAMQGAAYGESSGLWLQLGNWRLVVRALKKSELQTIFGFVADPKPAPGDPEC